MKNIYQYEYWVYNHRFQGTTIIPLGVKTIQITPVYESIAEKIQNTIPTDEGDLAENVLDINMNLRQSLPFLYEDNIHEFLITFDDEEDEKIKHYLRFENKPKTLYDLTKEQDMTCVEQTLAIKETALFDWQIYLKRKSVQGHTHKHIFLAKEIRPDYMTIIDPSRSIDSLDESLFTVKKDTFLQKYKPVDYKTNPNPKLPSATS